VVTSQDERSVSPSRIHQICVPAYPGPVWWVQIVVRVVIMIALQLSRAASGSQNAHSVYTVMLLES
jgi:hypothetical protein